MDKIDQFFGTLFKRTSESNNNGSDYFGEERGIFTGLCKEICWALARTMTESLQEAVCHLMIIYKKNTMFFFTVMNHIKIDNVHEIGPFRVAFAFVSKRVFGQNYSNENEFTCAFISIQFYVALTVRNTIPEGLHRLGKTCVAR